MSKLDELIAELCPDGVEYKPLESVCKIETGKLNANAAVEDGEYLFFTTAKEPSRINHYRWDTEALLIAGNANVGNVKYYIGKFEAYQRTYVLTDFDSSVSVKFLYYSLSNNLKVYLDSHKNEAAMTYIVLSTLQDFKIPVPPLPVQNEIVRILDNFTELTAELTAELQKRREQYRHYSTVLFDNAKKSGVHSIEEVCHIEKGKTPIQKATPGGYPMVVTTTERKSCDTYQFDAKAVCVPLVSSRGHGVASLNHVYYQEGKFALGNILCAIIPKNEKLVNPKYLYYYFEQTKDYTLVPLMKGGANVALHMNDVRKVKVPIPSLEEQKRIVDILDRFETLCNDILAGLPAEIEARQKQYEYYRDKLLTFKELS